ncbi:MAG: endonuclease, partial [Nocardioides sp.]|nr:endonuclease [Nocardioides sp.]
MTSTATLGNRGAPDAPGEVLAAARERTEAAMLAERDRFELAVEWGAMHSVDSLDRAATWALGHGGADALAIAGAGAPLVAEFCVAEFAAAIGMTHDSGKAYLGDAIEVRYRLTHLWAKVVDGTVPVWRARRVAQQTLSLSKPAASFVDRHVAAVAHKIGVAQLDRLIEEARVRFDPAEAERRRTEHADSRHLDLHTDRVGFDGTVHVEGELDLADALDLDAALAAGAQALADLGCDDSLDVRRAMAAGELARNQLALDLDHDTTGDD